MIAWLVSLVITLQYAAGMECDDWLHNGPYSCVTSSECIKENKVIFRNNCLNSCPDWTHFYDNDTHICYAECPVDSVVRGSHCLSPRTCTNKSLVVFNRTCVEACPDHFPYSKDGVCYSSCPPNSVLNATKCIDRAVCTGMGRYIYNDTCLKSCPKETPLVKYGTCLYTCTPDTVQDDTFCIYEKDCFKSGGVAYNGTCIDICPEEAPFNVSGKCYATCPDGYLLNDGCCVSVINCKNEGKYVSKGDCVSTCPPEAPLRDVNQHCVEKCSQFLVRYGSQCIPEDTCTSITQYYKVIYNGTCIDTCPDIAKFMNDRHCVESCPDNLVASGTECVSKDNCKTIGVVFDGKCMPACPKETRFEKDGECFISCPEGSVGENTTCIEDDKCKTKKKFIFNRLCVKKCPESAPLENDGNCLTKCPSSGDPSDGYVGRQMVIVNKTKCIDIRKCAEHGHFVYDEICVEECPALTAVNSNEYTICSPLNNVIIGAVISCFCFTMCVLILVSMLYNPAKPGKEVKQQALVKEEDTAVLQLEGGGEHPHRTVPEDKGDRGLVPNQEQPDENTDVRIHVDIHNDHDDDVPLLQADVSNGYNDDDDEAILFGDGS